MFLCSFKAHVLWSIEIRSISKNVLFASKAMNSLEGDLFALSDDDSLTEEKQCNPIQEHLLKQLADVNERIDRTKNDIQEMEEVTERILKTLDRRATYGDFDEDSDDSSPNDGDLYKVDGELVVKKKKHRSFKRSKTLVLKRLWQRVFDDKWVIGVELQNLSARILKDLSFLAMAQDTDPTQGVSTFWRPFDETFWSKTEEIEPREERIIATVVLESPSFARADACELHATVSYEVEGKHLQTAVPTVRLTFRDAADGSLGLEFSLEPEQSIVALKSASVERTALLELKSDSQRGARLLGFLENRNFREVHTDVYFAKASGSLAASLAEILPIENDVVRIRFYARSVAQMNILLRLLREEFPDVTTHEETHEDHLKCAEMALVQEIEMYLAGASEQQLQFARAKSDLLIP